MNISSAIPSSVLEQALEPSSTAPPALRSWAESSSQELGGDAKRDMTVPVGHFTARPNAHFRILKKKKDKTA